MKIEHPKGPRCLTFMASGQRIESVDLDVYEFPHECSVPNCPGNINRLKLEIFDKMIWALEDANQFDLPPLTRERVSTAIAEAKALKRL